MAEVKKGKVRIMQDSTFFVVKRSREAERIRVRIRIRGTFSAYLGFLHRRGQWISLQIMLDDQRTRY